MTRICVILALLTLTGCATSRGFMPDGSDTVPNNISCQFRGASFCHPKLIDV